MPIVRVALPLAAENLFDYWAPAGLGLVRGSVVRVPLGPRKLTGVVVELAASTAVAPEHVLNVDGVVPLPILPPDVIELIEFAAEYYQEARGLVYALALPPMTVARAVKRTATGDATLAVAPSALTSSALASRHNDAQKRAVTQIEAALGTYVPLLLFGVTGSGKTDVYLAAAGNVIARGGQVLLLVPEINLTPQLEQRISAALPGIRVATLHSGLAAGRRNANWRAAASGEAHLVLGTRLALFAPLPGLGLVVVDEEQDGSYKQQDSVRYNARDLAIWRARRRGIPIVLGSATPSLESWLHAQEGRYARVDLPQRADPRASLPAIHLVNAHAAHAREGIGDALHEGIARRLERGEQALVFVNRRGFAPSLLCSACGWAADCPRCSARLVVHRAPPSLRCHHCGHVESLHAACPECGNVDLLPLGLGTQRLERALAERFPQARLARVDRDTTRARGAFAAMRAQFDADELDILIGTQMLAKGHDFPRLTLVGVVGADNALYSADYRATERLAALLLQVAGRAGRANLPGEVIVQTDFPGHPVFAALRTHAYEPLAMELLVERKSAGLPPFVSAALLAAEAHDRADVDRFLQAAHAAGRGLVAAAHESVELFPPVPALMARRAGYERAQIVVQDARRGALQRFLSAWRLALLALPGRRVRWSLDVDPAGFG